MYAAGEVTGPGSGVNAKEGDCDMLKKDSRVLLLCRDVTESF